MGYNLGADVMEGNTCLHRTVSSILDKVVLKSDPI